MSDFRARERRVRPRHAAASANSSPTSRRRSQRPARPEDAAEAIRPRFAELLADPDWLPDELAAPVPGSGMGGGIGQWLLYRAEDESLSLFALVVPSGSSTPVHDHLAWGLVGLYRGEQDEEIYAREGEELRLVERRALRAGDFYALFPPHDDIHRVTTTSAETSVSIHLLHERHRLHLAAYLRPRDRRPAALPLGLRERRLRRERRVAGRRNSGDEPTLVPGAGGGLCGSLGRDRRRDRGGRRQRNVEGGSDEEPVLRARGGDLPVLRPEARQDPAADRRHHPFRDHRVREEGRADPEGRGEGGAPARGAARAPGTARSAGTSSTGARSPSSARRSVRPRRPI